jgi:glutaredoxin-related protein
LKIDPKASEAIQGFHSEFLANVKDVVERDVFVVVGMKQNPVVRDLRKDLSAAGIEFTYLEYGSYLSMWKERLSIKLWSGWPTFPQVFVRGTLIGGRKETLARLADGTLRQMLDTKAEHD